MKPIEAQELDRRIQDIPFDDYFQLMQLLVLGHNLLALGDRGGAEQIFAAVDRLADLLAPWSRKDKR